MVFFATLVVSCIVFFCVGSILKEFLFSFFFLFCSGVGFVFSRGFPF